MDISLRQIHAFVRLAEAGSFSSAAKLIHLSQPALTVQIRNLEQSLGGRLFDRNARGVELTRVGRDLLPAFQRMLRDLRHTVEEARDMAASRLGVVRIAALPSFAAGVLPEIIAEFRKARERVSFIVRDAVASRVMTLVRDEEVDLGIMGGEATDLDFEVVHQAADRMQVVFPAKHPLARKRKIGLADLAEHPLVLMAKDTSVRATVDMAFLAAGKTLILACEATYMMTAVGMVRAGLGITILPASAKEVQAEPSLKCRPIDDPRFTRTIAIIKRRHRTLPPVAQDFLAAMIPRMPA